MSFRSHFGRQLKAQRLYCYSRHFTGHSGLKIHPSVGEAIKDARPVVALESTIVAHGMPYPENLTLALEVIDILRSKGVTPATIAVKDGICQVGLDNNELEDLAKAGEEGRANKCSTRDLPIQMAMDYSSVKEGGHQWGATTVASTMRLAYLAGISTFATGGIGGVHRNGENSMDVSADLLELSNTPVIVVSAGIKSILDIDKTMEVLETHSVATLGWKTNEFPAFFSPKSGASCRRADNAEMVSRIYWASRFLKLRSGMLVAVPNHDPAGASVELAIQTALREIEEKKITGQAITPYVLRAVATKTGGDSLRSNMALVRENARVAADIAIAVSKASAK